jgi:Gram-negative bacterial TonB protein C-terminal
MNGRLFILAILVCAGNLAAAESKGFCPPTPPKPSVVPEARTVAPQASPSPDAEYAGSVMLMAVISDRGYVCDAHVIHGLDKDSDKKAAQAVRLWHFQPARKDGHAVPVVVTVEVNYWRKDGELIQFPATPSATPAQEQSGRN